jgi:hypothetical protein
MFRALQITMVGLLMVASLAVAQGPAGRKATGEVYRQGSTRQRHAYDYARVLNQSGRESPRVAKTTVQENIQSIRQNSQAATKEFAKLKAAEPDNKTAQALIDSIEKRHAKVLEMCSVLDEECKKGDAAGVKVCECCVTMAKELDAAAKDAEKLREALKIEPLSDPLKEEASK